MCSAFIDQIWSHVERRWRVEDKRRLSLPPAGAAGVGISSSERQRKRRLYLKGRVLSALRKLEKFHPHFAVPVTRDLIQAFFFNLIDGRYPSPESLRSAIGGIRWAAARAAGVEYDETILSSMEDLEAKASSSSSSPGSIAESAGVRTPPPTPPPSLAEDRLEEIEDDFEIIPPLPGLRDENLERSEKEREGRIEEIPTEHPQTGGGGEEGRIGVDQAADGSALLQQRSSKKEEKTREEEFEERSPSSTPHHEESRLSFLQIEDPSSSRPAPEGVSSPVSISRRLTQLWRQRAFPLSRFQQLQQRDDEERRRERHDLREVARSLLAAEKREDEEGGDRPPPPPAREEREGSSSVGKKFGRQVHVETFHQFAFHVAARREGMLKWMRPYRINPYQLVLDVLLTVQSGKRKSSQEKERRQPERCVEKEREIRVSVNVYV